MEIFTTNLQGWKKRDISIIFGNDFLIEIIPKPCIEESFCSYEGSFLYFNFYYMYWMHECKNDFVSYYSKGDAFVLGHNIR